jgi:hypothetical protein
MPFYKKNGFWIWITTEKSFHRKFMTERPFDRNTVGRLTESSFYRRKSFGRKQNWSKGRLAKKYLENGHLTENPTWKTSQMTESSFDCKLFSKNGHLTEGSFDQKFIWPKAFSKKWSFDRKVIWPRVHLTECFFSKNEHLTKCFFRKMVIWPKKFLTKGKTTLIYH